ncbi:MAG TPA: cysteine--tRNA ligase [Candidatus Saccharimonadales bacterium]|nr:cysteine--tRNA ligase [Candidatus Saccharimonadales bacterium]
MVKLYSTLSRKIEEFTAINPPRVGMYSCGPTVYDYQHIGHMRRYVGDDILVRVLEANGYTVKHVMNITDVGHLVSDSDTGEDKMEKGAKKFGKSVWEVAKMFEEQFWASTDALNIQRPNPVMHATDYIKEQIALVQELEEKGYTYQTTDGIYFDTSKFPDYFNLSRQNPDQLQAGARVDMGEKRHVSDFALWKFSYSGGITSEEMLKQVQHDGSQIQKRQMEWESPWGIGFPGWHIECSAMSIRALGPHFDIHTGGIDHIAIHHTNEIAQAECATGQKFVNFWVHHNFLVVEGTKMSKSLGNFITVQDVAAKGYDPLALRYIYLQTHYRQEMNFTWEALAGAEKAYKRLISVIASEAKQSDNPEKIATNSSSSRHDEFKTEFEQDFLDALNDDLNTAKALAILWELVKSEIPSREKLQSLKKFDQVLGLALFKKAGDFGYLKGTSFIPTGGLPSPMGREAAQAGMTIPQEVMDLVNSREDFRKAGDFGASDEMRKKIADLGFRVKDTKEGPKIEKK